MMGLCRACVGWLVVFVSVVWVNTAWATNTDPLRDSVVVVRPRLFPESERLLMALSEFFDSQKVPNAARAFRRQAEFAGFGSGWYVRGANGRLYVVTNRHVIGFSGTAALIKERLDARGEPNVTSTLGRVVFVSDESDLAILAVADEPTQPALKIHTGPVAGGMVVWSAGFPGLGGQPLWQAAQGNVTNSSVPPLGGGAFRLIQHSAPIDGGNSGGPLLVEVAESKFQVVGVNTFKGLDRENVSLAVGVPELLAALAKAERAHEQSGDSALMKAALDEQGAALAAELGSARPRLEPLLSRRYIVRRGWGSFNAVFRGYTKEQQAKALNALVQDPLPALRVAAAVNLAELSRLEGDNPRVTFLGINPSDASSLTKDAEVRSRFDFAGRELEVSWLYEHGHWRISDESLGLVMKEALAKLRAKASEPSSEATPTSAGETDTGTATATPVAKRDAVSPADAVDAAEARPLRRKVSGLVVVPRGAVLPASRVGVTVGLSGCGNSCPEASSSDEELPLETGLLVGADVMWSLTKHFRLGLTGSYVPALVEADSGFEYGSEVDVGSAAEYVFDVSPAFAVLIHGQLAAGILVTASDFDALTEGLVQTCSNGSSRDCKLGTSAPMGGAFGLGLGLLFPFDGYGLRVEASMQRSHFPITIEGDDDLEFDINFTNDRFSLGIAAEL